VDIGGGAHTLLQGQSVACSIENTILSSGSDEVTSAAPAHSVTIFLGGDVMTPSASTA
jgi:hypothetical protein